MRVVENCNYVFVFLKKSWWVIIGMKELGCQNTTLLSSKPRNEINGFHGN